MKEAFWSAAVVMAGLVGLALIFLFQNISTTNEQNYYLLREVTEASMLEAVDIAYYRQFGVLRIHEEKFVENFIRRWSESADRARTYDIYIYDVIEVPPKVSIRVISGGEEFLVTGDSFNISNQIDAILETKY